MSILRTSVVAFVLAASAITGIVAVTATVDQAQAQTRCSNDNGSSCR